MGTLLFQAMLLERLCYTQDDLCHRWIRTRRFPCLCAVLGNRCAQATEDLLRIEGIRRDRKQQIRSVTSDSLVGAVCRIECYAVTLAEIVDCAIHGIQSPAQALSADIVSSRVQFHNAG